MVDSVESTSTSASSTDRTREESLLLMLRPPSNMDRSVMAEPNSFAPLLILTNAIQLFNGETQIPVKFRKNPRILHHKGKKRYPVPEHSGTGYRSRVAVMRG